VDEVEMQVRRLTAKVFALGALTLVPAGVSFPVLAGKAGEVRTRSFQLLNEGVAAYRRGQFALAVEKLSESSGMALNSFRAHYYLGLALIGDRRYGDALRTLEVALDLDPNHLQAIVATGDAHLKMGDIDESRATFYRALKLRPEYPPALDGLARVEEARANDDEAIKTYLRAIASDKGFAPPYTHLGDLYLRMGRVEEAVHLLEEAVEVRPDFAPGLNRLALAYGRLGLHNEAIVTVQKAMEIEPNNALHAATLGELQLNQRFVQVAERSFLRALELDPGLPEARRGLAEVARRRGLYDQALGQIDLALSDPRVDSATRTRTEKYRDLVVSERKKVAELERRLRDGEASAEEHAALAEIYASRGLWNEAVELQRQAGASAAERELLAYMLFQANRYREAHEIYSELAGSDSGVNAKVNDGVTLALLGDDEGAVASYRRALEAQPDHPRARLYLANALLRLGRRDEAVEAYTAFLDLGFRGEAAERVRRILQQIAPGLLPPGPSPLDPPPPTREEIESQEGGSPS
jgi:tetratricopeptide (TPR) repeat protein